MIFLYATTSKNICKSCIHLMVSFSIIDRLVCLNSEIAEKCCYNYPEPKVTPYGPNLKNVK